MEERSRFQAETAYDLANYKEFTAGYRYTAIGPLLLKLIPLVLTVYLLSLFPLLRDVAFFAKWLLLLCGSYLIGELIGRFITRNGDVNYKRTIMTNGGTPPVNKMRFEENAIICINAANGNTVNYSYDQTKWLFETENLLVAVMKLRLCLMIDKRTVTGGSLSEFKEFLLSKSVNIKRKKFRRCTFGKWLHRIQIAVTVLCMLFALANLPGIALFDRFSGKLPNSMSYQEIAAELAGLGIQISDQAIAEVEEFDANYLKENGIAFYEDHPAASKAMDLVCWEATGFYDEETWEWTPSTSGLYWFDTEVWNEAAIYTDFFTGLSCMHRELSFTNVSEDFSGADTDAGTGTIVVSFTLNGTPHQLEAEYCYDWFDVNFLRQIGVLLSEDDSENALYYFFDGQAILLYYGTEETANALEDMTGLLFFPVTQLRID